MTYYLEEHPNLNLAQFGWLRVRIWESGQHLSGVIGVHTSEAITDFEGPDWNAENNAKFLETRTNHGSYTTSADADSILPLVHPRWAAWADITNNVHAMSVAGCLQAARWREMAPERAAAVVRNMAIATARMVQTAVADGYLAEPTPAVRISAAEAISGSRPGFYGHGETNPGTRYDPGVHFDWGLFLSTYASAIGGGISLQGSTTSEEDDMSEALDKVNLLLDRQLENHLVTQRKLDANHLVTHQKLDGNHLIIQRRLDLFNDLLVNVAGAINRPGEEAFDAQKLIDGVRDAAATANQDLVDSLRAELVSGVAAAVGLKLEELDVEGDVRNGVMAAVESITTTTTAQIKGS